MNKVRGVGRVARKGLVSYGLVGRDPAVKKDSEINDVV
jgi:hypothetical protein